MKFAMHAILSFVLFGVSSLASAQATGPYANRDIDVQIRRTSYGIPHIKANNYVSLGYGIAYAYAEDNLCLMADRFLTARGERSLYLGPSAQVFVGLEPVGNFEADVYVRGYFDDASIAQQFGKISGEAQQLIAGYVRGYNRYLADTPASSLPAECAGAPWVRPITTQDMYRNLLLGATLASGVPFVQGIAFAAPPGGAAAANAGNASLPLANLPGHRSTFLGSNAVAIGSQASENGSGVLLGNPHFPWDGPLRFYQMHLTIPNKLNVMGAALPGFPMVQVGFNETLAWSHTISTGVRFTLYELTLKPGEPTTYVYEGQERAMQPRVVAVPIGLPGGGMVQQNVTLYRSHFGAMVINPPAGLQWSESKAYAIRDANIDNVRMIDQWIGMARAGGVPTLKTALEDELGLPWVNTVAADDKGRVLYADISVKPNVTQAQFNACLQGPFGQALFQNAGLVLLDGTRSACEWKKRSGAAPNTLPPSALPSLVRRDFVQNSNDSYWLSNPAAPLTGFSPVVGVAGIPQSLRTRVGLIQIADRFSNADGLGGSKFSDLHLQQILFGNRNHAAELTVDAFVPVCQANPLVTVDGTTVNIGPACAVLAAWDRRNDSSSVGAHVFREWWSRIAVIPGVFATPFNPADPVHTPRDLNVANNAIRTALLQSFARGVRILQDNGIPIDAPWGQLHYRFAGSPIPLHGGPSLEGVYNAVDSYRAPDPANPGGVTPFGYVPVIGGSSYIQTVSFNNRGPVAHAILSFSQSSQAASPHYADQTAALFSAEEWHRLPFSEADIKADAAYSVKRLREN
ncbi:MAG TPA: penicillin acylase family protein [Burkholderiales bacterium]|nr:penicillin acylase family protein [Burkholderiales bacterium]